MRPFPCPHHLALCPRHILRTALPCFSQDAVRAVVDLALEMESHAKKKATSRARIKLSDSDGPVQVFKEFTEEVAHKLKLL